MSDPGATAFLRQAHRNNWQQYLAALQPGARTGWDVCVLTASDDRQAAMYRRQLYWRQEAGLLPSCTRFLVLADPGGRRIGSGGATLRAMLHVADAHPQRFRGQRALIIHSGGDSKRLPHCSAIGKLFARVPRTLPDGRASTIFDEFLISLSGLVTGLPSGVLVASGDVLLIFDHLQLSFQRSGVIGVGAATPSEMGLRHGVYASGDRDHSVRAYLHKPGAEELTRWGAVTGEGMVQIDTGLVWVDAGTAERMLALTADEAVKDAGGFLQPQNASPPPVGLNFYGDLLLPLAASTTYEDYLVDTSDGPATPPVQAARAAIWRCLRGTPFTVEQLKPAVFLHFGTSAEYWQMAAGDAGLAELCGWTEQAASWRGGPATPGGRDVILINSAMESARVEVTAGRPALITDSQLDGSFSARGAAIVAGVETTEPLALAAGTVLHQLAVAAGKPIAARGGRSPAGEGFVTRVFGLHDDPKQRWDAPGATFVGRSWSRWLQEAGLTPDDLWAGLPPGERSLWTAALYPCSATREESLRLSLPLQDPAAAPAHWRAEWLADPRLSLAESFARANGEGLLAGMAALEDRIAARRFLAAVEAEVPAAQARGILGNVPANTARRSEIAAAGLAAASPLLQLRGYKALAETTGDPGWEDRAFGTLAEMIERATPSFQEIIGRPGPRGGESGSPGGGARRTAERVAVRVEAAARIDFGGGWTDTPPHSIERGGTVLNAALTLRGVYPLVAEAARLPEPRLVLESRDIDAVFEPVRAGEVLTFTNLSDPFALHKAALVLRGILPANCDPDTPVAAALKEWGGGLRLSTGSDIPRGSGLGTSSIMAGAVLECLGRLQENAADRPPTDRTPARLFDEVLCLEQMITTGGGWQDQAGGLTGGIKLITSEPGLPQRIHLRPVALPPAAAAGLAERLLLIYTGQQRLAKNLLRYIMARWMARDPEIVWILGEIGRLAVSMRDALENGDLDGFGALLGEHWALNKRIDPGCTNPFIDELFDVMQPHTNGGKLAGAGGGGFVIAVARDRQAVHDLSRALATRYPGTPVAIWPCAVPTEGLR